MQFDGWYIHSKPKFEYVEETDQFVLAEGQGDDNWIFLFVDLVYVAIFAKLNHLIDNCNLSLHTIAVVGSVFLVAFTSRLTIDEYSNRFYANDVFHRVVYLFYTAGIFCMGLNVTYVATTELGLPGGQCGASIFGLGFSSGFIITRLMIILLYASVCQGDKYAAAQFRGHIYKSCIQVRTCAKYTHKIKPLHFVSSSHNSHITNNTGVYCDYFVGHRLREHLDQCAFACHFLHAHRVGRIPTSVYQSRVPALGATGVVRRGRGHACPLLDRVCSLPSGHIRTPKQTRRIRHDGAR